MQLIYGNTRGTLKQVMELYTFKTMEIKQVELFIMHKVIQNIWQTIKIIELKIFKNYISFIYKARIKY